MRIKIWTFLVRPDGSEIEILPLYRCFFCKPLEIRNFPKVSLEIRTFLKLKIYPSIGVSSVNPWKSGISKIFLTRKSEHFEKVSLEIQPFLKLKNYPSIGGVHIFSGIAQSEWVFFVRKSYAVPSHDISLP